MAAITPTTTLSQRAARFVARELELSRYKAALVDLNRDGSLEILVYSQDRSACGSGGCVLYVLTPHRQSYRVTAATTITWPPIRMLTTRSNGWHDLGVWVEGGGIMPGYEARLRFNGSRYPGNPTVKPSLPAGKVRGHVLLQ